MGAITKLIMLLDLDYISLLTYEYLSLAALVEFFYKGEFVYNNI
jgi:hypothetical protein